MGQFLSHRAALAGQCPLGHTTCSQCFRSCIDEGDPPTGFLEKLLFKTLEIIASSKVDYFLDKTPINFKPGDEVNLLIAESTPLGKKVIINNSHWGLIHTAEIFQTLVYGKKIKGFIKTIRDDGKIDVVLRKAGQDSISELAQRILAELGQAGGFLALHDKSSPLEIQRAFGESKKSFKSAIGQLYKQGAIHIEATGIRLQPKK